MNPYGTTYNPAYPLPSQCPSYASNAASYPLAPGGGYGLAYPSVGQIFQGVDPTPPAPAPFLSQAWWGEPTPVLGTPNWATYSALAALTTIGYGWYSGWFDGATGATGRTRARDVAGDATRRRRRRSTSTTRRRRDASSTSASRARRSTRALGY